MRNKRACGDMQRFILDETKYTGVILPITAIAEDDESWPIKLLQRNSRNRRDLHLSKFDGAWAMVRYGPFAPGEVHPDEVYLFQNISSFG